jgi:lipoyl(octanoyl) transferase
VLRCSPERVRTRRLLVHALTPTATQIQYTRAWAWQKALVRRRLAALDAGGAPASDELLLLQHAPVYTLGTGSTPANLRFDPAAPPFELHRTERGGEATYHGPGQLVMYPILDLK